MKVNGIARPRAGPRRNAPRPPGRGCSRRAGACSPRTATRRSRRRRSSTPPASRGARSITSSATRQGCSPRSTRKSSAIVVAAIIDAHRGGRTRRPAGGDAHRRPIVPRGVLGSRRAAHRADRRARRARLGTLARGRHEVRPRRHRGDAGAGDGRRGDPRPADCARRRTSCSARSTRPPSTCRGPTTPTRRCEQMYAVCDRLISGIAGRMRTAQDRQAQCPRRCSTRRLDGRPARRPTRHQTGGSSAIAPETAPNRRPGLRGPARPAVPGQRRRLPALRQTRARLRRRRAVLGMAARLGARRDGDGCGRLPRGLRRRGLARRAPHARDRAAGAARTTAPTRTSTTARTCSTKCRRISTSRTGGTAPRSTHPPGHTTYQLNFPGINYRAEIWLNGHLVADAKQDGRHVRRPRARRDAVDQAAGSPTRWPSRSPRSGRCRTSTASSSPTAGSTGSTGTTSAIRGRTRTRPTATRSSPTATPGSGNPCTCACPARWRSAPPP